MRVIGIDPGLTVTGFGIIEFENQSFRLIDCGKIQSRPGEDISTKLGKIYNDLCKIINEVTPTEMAIEDVFVSVNARSALKLGQAMGSAVLAGINNSLKIFEYSPLKIKMAVTGYGRAEKSQMQQMIKLLLKLDKELSSHESDALGVAICHINSRSFDERVLS